MGDTTRECLRMEWNSEWNSPPLLTHPPEVCSAGCNHIRKFTSVCVQTVLATRDRSILEFTEGENQ